MNDFINTIVERRTIRKYKKKQIADNELNAILEAGLHAPNAGGRQSAIIVVSQDENTNHDLGKLSKAAMPPVKPSMGNVSSEQPSILDDENITSAFYDAPTLLVLFAIKDNYNLTGDCFVAAQNMIMAAHSLGIGSCMVARASETFASGRGKEIKDGWGIGEELEARVFVTLGYPEGDAPKYKPRKGSRVIRV